MKAKGHYGIYGGQYVAETLMGPLAELEAAYAEAKNDPAFQREFNEILHDYVGRESPITHCRRLSAHLGGAQILLKREDLNHTGAHKVNNTIGQALLAKRMGKKRLPRRARACTAWRRRRWRRCSACRARCTWARSTWTVRRRTSSA